MKTSLLFCLFTFSLSAQIKGVVKDSISGKPIPFVSIWSENQNIGTTSEEDGTFTINTNENSKKIIFSALGFEKKTVKIKDVVEVKLHPTDIQLDEVVISKSLGTKQIEIGKTNNTICQAFDNGPRIDVKYFPYLSSYKKTRYIKNVTIYT
ncbi:MAG: carboxypeptidase-like regulatory domain-containing protein, partial [Bacteroidota bacterium]